MNEIWHTITSNKMRSLLTAFGVFWGIFMLVVMVGLGVGMSNTMMNGLDKFDANSTFLFSNSTTMPYKGFAQGRYWQMKLDDVDALKKNFPDITNISPMVFTYSNNDNVVYKDKAGKFRVIGVAADMNKINPSKILQGRYINNIDEQEKRKVCLIGEKVLNDLYAHGEDPLNSRIRVDGIYYTVMGVVDDMSKNVNIFGSMDEQIMCPYTTLMAATNAGDKFGYIGISAAHHVDIREMEKDISLFLRTRAMVSPDDEDAIMSFNTKAIFESFNMLGFGISFLIWAVGLGTLLSGCVGVSNIMLVTVRERTQEIGVRRALGAAPSVIIRQILSESVVLTLLAGITGLVSGVGVLAVVEMLAGEQFLNPIIPFDLAIIALIILIVFGLLAGWLPAQRALSIKAIDALRDE